MIVHSCCNVLSLREMQAILNVKPQRTKNVWKQKQDGFSYKSFFNACGDGNMACELVGLDCNYL